MAVEKQATRSNSRTLIRCMISLLGMKSELFCGTETERKKRGACATQDRSGRRPSFAFPLGGILSPGGLGVKEKPQRNCRKQGSFRNLPHEGRGLASFRRPGTLSPRRA